MIKRTLLLLFSLSIGLLTCQSKIIASLSMESSILNTSVKYSVYLPDGFEKTDQSYPVVYLLNGFTGDETDWIRLGHVKDITDQLINGKQIDPIVIIMPDGDDRLYMNKDDGTYNYEDMFIKELMPFVENKYRIKKDKNARGISGLSMGGAGSLRLALKYHDLFGACAAFSAGLGTEEEIINEDQGSFDYYFGRISPSTIGVKGKDRMNATLKDYSLYDMVKTKNKNQLKSVDIYFDCGDDDFLAIGNATLHIELTKRGIPHEYRVRDGAHTWNFWVESLPIGLTFIGNSMRFSE